MAGPTKNSEGGKKMSKNEIPKQDPKQKKGLTNALKYFFGVGDAGFVLMSNIETFYFMTFLTDLAGFAAGVAGVINSVFTIVDACLSWLYGGIINGTKAKKWGRYRSWLIMVPWMVPFLYAFMFIRVSDNEWLSAVVIIAASIASHVAWNFSYVETYTLRPTVAGDSATAIHPQLTCSWQPNVTYLPPAPDNTWHFTATRKPE